MSPDAVLARPSAQHSTQRKVPRGLEDAERLTADVIELARQYGSYDYRKVAALWRQVG
jgi:putative transposase